MNTHGCRSIKRRELVAWIIAVTQFLYLLLVSNLLIPYAPEDDNSYQKNSIDNHDSFLQMNKHQSEYYERRCVQAIESDSRSFYEPPIVHSKEAGLLSRIWRSIGSPFINPNLLQGTCWCSADDCAHNLWL